MSNCSNKSNKNCSNLKIYCRVASKPKEWENDWNPDNRTVTWGYTGN